MIEVNRFFFGLNVSRCQANLRRVCLFSMSDLTLRKSSTGILCRLTFPVKGALSVSSTVSDGTWHECFISYGGVPPKAIAESMSFHEIPGSL